MFVYNPAFPPLQDVRSHVLCRVLSIENTPRRSRLHVCESATLAVPKWEESRLRRIHFRSTRSTENEIGDCLLALRSPMTLLCLEVHIRFIFSDALPLSNTKFRIECRTSSGSCISQQGAELPGASQTARLAALPTIPDRMRGGRW